MSHRSRPPAPPLLPDPRLIHNRDGDVKDERRAKDHALGTLRDSLGLGPSEDALAALDEWREGRRK